MEWIRRSANNIVVSLFYLLMAVFLVLYINDLELSKITEADINFGYFAVAVFFGLLSLAWGAYMWLLVLMMLGSGKIGDKLGLFYVYAKSWLGRYIPGTAPWILGKIYFASRYGISKAKLATSSILEALLQLASTLLVSFLLIIASSNSVMIPPGLRLIFYLGSLAIFIALIPAVFNFLLRTLLKVLKKGGLKKENSVRFRLVAQGTSLYSVSTLLSGLAMFFVAKAIYEPLGTSDMAYVMGASTLSGAVGMMAVFVPSGIGVREGVQTAMLSVVMPVEFALLVAVASRLWGIIVDILFFGIFKLAYMQAGYDSVQEHARQEL